MNFYKHHIGDYDADTSHLTWDEDMAYTRMIRAYYRRERPLPADAKEVCRLVRATSKAQRDAVGTVLNEFFALADDGWHQKRCDEELTVANEKAELNRTNGKKGGRPRKEKTEQEPNGNPDGFYKKNPNGFDSESEKNLIQTPDSRLQTPDSTSQTPDLKTGETVVNVIKGGITPRGASDDFTPKDPAEWLRHFRTKHGFEADPTNVNDRKKLWPVFAGWVNAGLTAQFVDAAVATAIAGSKSVIGCLPVYVDRVIAQQSQPQQTRLSPDEHRRAISEANGAAWLAQSDPNVIDMEI